MQFQSNIFILPGLGNSGEQHWQSLWEKQFGFTRIQQKEWDKPVCSDWIATIDNELIKYDLSKVILVGHSAACAAIAAWSHTYKRNIKGALLVAPSDSEAKSYPEGPAGFSPIILKPLSFPSIVVMSENDFYVTAERAKYFAACWGSKIRNIGNAGHINVTAGFGKWDEGLEFLRELDIR